MSEPAPLKPRVQFHICVLDANNHVRILCGEKNADYLLNAHYALKLDPEDLCPNCKRELQVKDTPVVSGGALSDHPHV